MAAMPASMLPFDIGLAIARLATPLPGALRAVGTSADMAAITQLRDFPAPCAYVLLAREKATKTSSGASIPGQQSARSQLITVTFGVVLVVRNLRAQRGDALRDELRDSLGALRSRLLGWTPPLPSATACELVQGDLSDYDAGTAIWTDIWRTQHTLNNGVSA